MEEFVAALRAEKERLRSHLETIPEFQKYESVSMLLMQYEDGLGASPPETPPGQSPPPPLAGEQPSVAPAQRGMTAIQDAAFDFLGRKGARASSPEIHKELIRLGLVEPGERGRKMITSYLSRDNTNFDNKRGEGYGLVEWSSRPRKSDPHEGGGSDVSSAARMNGAGLAAL